MQAKLKIKLSKDYYTTDELIEILELKANAAERCVKGLMLHKEGYAKEDIIFRLMGRKNYL